MQNNARMQSIRRPGRHDARMRFSPQLALRPIVSNGLPYRHLTLRFFISPRKARHPRCPVLDDGLIFGGTLLPGSIMFHPAAPFLNMPFSIALHVVGI